MGPSEFTITGSFKSFNIVDQLHKIAVPTLMINGRYDEAQDSTMAPFFSHIQKVKWITFAESSHTPHWEERERYIEIVGDFLRAE
jgi:pimeloyl-ACP methyl ester carboxylesterase